MTQAGFGNSDLGKIPTVVAVYALILNTFAGEVALAGMTARFPMVNGRDGSCLRGGARLHPRFRTPVQGPPR